MQEQLKNPFASTSNMLDIPEPTRQIVGHLLVALHKKGISRIHISRAEIEDDMWEAVTITRYNDLNEGGVNLFWSVRGISCLTEILAPKESLVHPWYLIIIAVLGIVLGYLIGVTK